mgnify:CR=1 FL=1
MRKRICWSRSLQKQAIEVKKTRSFCCVLPTKKKGYILPTSPRVERLLEFYLYFSPALTLSILLFLKVLLFFVFWQNVYYLVSFCIFEKKKTSFLRPKGNTFEELPIFLTFCPQCCFLAQSFLFQVHGQFCLKTLMLSVFFFLKKSLLFAKSNKKKTNEQIQNNELFSSC